MHIRKFTQFDVAGVPIFH